MTEVILVIAVLVVLMALTDYLWRKQVLRGEYARKFAHIFAGILGAASPFFLSWQEIQIIWCVGIVTLVLAKRLGLFKSVYDIKRKSWGDVLGPVALGLITFLEPHPALFSAVVLHVALADGLAAVIGVRYGLSNRYRVLGTTKSIAGSSAFLGCSIVINMGLYLLSGLNFGPNGTGSLLVVSAGATLAENIAIRGLDNVIVPVYVLIFLSLLVH